MAVWLLTWNPEKWDVWDTYDEDCEKASEEHPLIDSWSCRSKQAREGEEFFLMKLGKPPRGIIAHGIIIEANITYRHWDYDKEEESINYVKGKWDTLLNYKTQAILDASVLDEECRPQQWHPQSSGIHIREEVLPKLRELWAELTGSPEESVYVEAEAGGTLEGTKRLVYTARYERDPKIRRAFLKGKHLKCEVCGFDFEETYGELGAGYIEVHHKKPVSEGIRMTDLNSGLVMLCSNCHRMIHRGKDHMITVEELKSLRRRNAHVPDTHQERNSD